MFGQLSLEGLSDFEPTKKSNNKEAKQQKPAAQGQTKSDEKKAAAKKATKPEVSPLAEDTVIAKGKLFCPPAIFDIENKSVKELKELLKEKSFQTTLLLSEECAGNRIKGSSEGSGKGREEG